MISKLRGKIDFVGNSFILLDVGGVGYKIFATLETIRINSKNTNSEISLWTHLSVKETALDLYGFGEKNELDFFELLISISGIGPKSALGILDTANIETLRNAVGSGDTTHLTKVSGIGKKNAEKIVLELRDKLGGIGESNNGSELLREETDALDALVALGYSGQEARQVIKDMDKDIEGTNEKIREALRILGK